MKALGALALLLAVPWVPGALGSSRVVGGAPADVRSAPWSVVIVHGTQNQSLCTGVIVDADHVLTAAHCVLDSGGVVALPHTFLVRAGVTNAVTPTATDVRQDRAVAAIRVHPGYRDEPRADADDVAVLALASPLDLGGPNAQAIALPGPELALRSGQPVALAGFGTTAPTGSNAVALNRMNSTVIDDSACLGPADDRYDAVLVCAFSGTNAPCHGDSGAALVITTPTPVAVGVTGSGTAGCGANTVALFADLTAPEILRFVEGDDAPPTAPRQTMPPALALSTPTPQVGQTVRCVPGEWSGEPTLAYSFREGTNDLLLRAGSSVYPLRIVDAGRAVRCRVAATNAGGTSTADSPDSPPVLPAPELSAAAAGGTRPGGVALLRVAFVRWAQPIGNVTVCAASPRVGTRVCRTTTLAPGVRPTVVLRFPVKRTAPVARTRLAVTARSADGRSAGASTTLRVG